MIDIQVVVDRLKSQLSYTVELSRDTEINTQDLSTLPIIYVGYASLDTKNPNAAIALSYLDENGEDMVQTFDLKIVSTIADLSVVVRNVHKAINGFTPIPSDNTSFTSCFSFAQGGVIGLSNGKIWWVSRYRIGMPTINVIF